MLVHEIGHALGLGHSFVTGAVMNPVYQGYNGGLTLHEDDINGMRLLYGRFYICYGREKKSGKFSQRFYILLTANKMFSPAKLLKLSLTRSSNNFYQHCIFLVFFTIILHVPWFSIYFPHLFAKLTFRNLPNLNFFFRWGKGEMGIM